MRSGDKQIFLGSGRPGAVMEPMDEDALSNLKFNNCLCSSFYR